MAHNATRPTFTAATTVTATAQTSATEMWQTFKTSDSTGKIEIYNASTTDAVALPTIKFTGTGTEVAGLLGGISNTESASSYAQWSYARVGASTSPAVRPLFSWCNNGTILMQMNKDRNLGIGGVATTSITHLWTVSRGSAATSGAAGLLKVVPPADTLHTASTEGHTFLLDTATRTWATGAITTQRENLFSAQTYAFDSASTITNAATVVIQGPPTVSTGTFSKNLSTWTLVSVLRKTPTHAVAANPLNGDGGVMAMSENSTSSTTYYTYQDNVVAASTSVTMSVYAKVPPLSINKLTCSDDLTNSTCWSTSLVTVASTVETTDPDGGNTAFKMSYSGGGSTTAPYIRQDFSTYGRSRLGSVYVKRGNYDFIKIGFRSYGGAGGCVAFNINTGEVHSMTAGSSAAQAPFFEIEDAGNGWWRISAGVVSSSSTITFRISMTDFTDSDSDWSTNTNPLPDDAYCYLYGPMLEPLTEDYRLWKGNDLGHLSFTAASLGVDFTSDHATAPDLSNDAVLLTDNDDSTSHYLGRENCFRAGSRVCVSGYFKLEPGSTHTTATIATDITNEFYTLDLQSLAATTGASATSGGYSSEGNGWYRIWVYVNNTTGTSIHVRLQNDSGTHVYTKASTDTDRKIQVWGLQYDLNTSTPEDYETWTPPSPSAYTATGDYTHSKFEISENDLTYSEDFSQSVWTKTNTTNTSLVEVSPEGPRTANLLVDDGTNGNHALVHSLTTSSGATIPAVWSIFVKKYDATINGGQPSVRLWSTVDANAEIHFNLDTQQMFVGSSVTASGYTDEGDGWYRIWFRLASATASSKFELMMGYGASTTNTMTYSYAGLGERILVWGAQFQRHGTTLVDYSGTFAYRQNRFAWLGTATTSTSERACFDLLHGTCETPVGTEASSSITDVGDGWYRCSYTVTPAAASRMRFGMTDGTIDSSGNINPTHIGYVGNNMLFWGPQVDLGALTAYSATPIASSITNSLSLIHI